MKRACFAIIAVMLATGTVRAQDYQTDFPPEEFRARQLTADS